MKLIRLKIRFKLKIKLTIKNIFHKIQLLITQDYFKQKKIFYKIIKILIILKLTEKKFIVYIYINDFMNKLFLNSLNFDLIIKL